MATLTQTNVTGALAHLGFESKPLPDGQDPIVGGTQYFVATDKAKSVLGPVLEGAAKLAVSSDGSVTVVE